MTADAMEVIGDRLGSIKSISENGPAYAVPDSEPDTIVLPPLVAGVIIFALVVMIVILLAVVILVAKRRMADK